MKSARNAGLILLGIVIWIAGFVFISTPAITEWNDCWKMSRLDGGAESGFYCHVPEVSYGGCDQSGLCIDGYSPEMTTSVPGLGICLTLPAVPFIVIVIVLARQRAKDKECR